MEQPSSFDHRPLHLPARIGRYAPAARRPAHAALRTGAIAELSGWSLLRSDAAWGSSRVDFLLGRRDGSGRGIRPADGGLPEDGERVEGGGRAADAIELGPPAPVVG